MLLIHRTFFSLHVYFPRHFQMLLKCPKLTLRRWLSAHCPQHSSLQQLLQLFLRSLVLESPHFSTPPPPCPNSVCNEWRVFNLKIKCPFGKWKIIFSQAHFNLTWNSKSFTIHFFSIIIKVWSMYTSCHRQLSSFFIHFFFHPAVMENRYALEETPVGDLCKRKGRRRPTSS